MSKSLLAVTIGALAVASTANANWYAQGDLGYSKVKASGFEDSNISDRVFSPTLAVGYDFGDWRLAVDYSHYGKVKHDLSGGNVVAKGSLRNRGIGFSAIYDFNLNSPLVPYVGLRIAENFLKFDGSYFVNFNNASRRSSYSETKTKLGYGVLAGVQYQLASKWSLNGGVEYNRLGKLDKIKVNQYGIKFGIRYDF